MSSGYYSYTPPKPSYVEICQQNIDRLNKEKENISIIYKETFEEIESVLETIKKGKQQVLNYNYTSEKTSIDGMVTLDSTETHSGVDLEELFFAEIEVNTGNITFIAIDFSDQISPKNAVNSTEYKKMVLSSRIIKSLMSCCFSEQIEKDIDGLIITINKMLDDKSVDFDFFSEHILKRYNLLMTRASKDTKIAEEKWELYCALCALNSVKPKHISSIEIDKEIDDLSSQVFQKNYLKKAREALIETLDELGLKVADDFELEKINGSLVKDEENLDYQLFLSSDDESFALEMIETEKSTHSDTQQRLMCGKRKMIYEIMSKKGFPLTICAENDDSAVTGSIQKREKSQDSNIDKLLRKRAIEGRIGKARKIGA